MPDINEDAKSVLEFWFGNGKDLKEHFKLWFGGKEQDEGIRAKFDLMIEKARNGELKSWKENTKTALAHIILIDQFCRNVHRGTAKSFDCDPISLAISKELISGERINHKDLSPMERIFVYIPLEHSENMDDQNLSCTMFEELVKETEGTEWHEPVRTILSCAEQHREVIAKFGRFPKRNAAIGRINTPEEEEILKNYPYMF